MRITNQMMNRMLTGYISDNQSASYRKQEEISSGKRMQQASDDPLAWAAATQLHGREADFAVYENNSTLMDGKLTALEQGLATAGDILQRASELSVQASDGTLSISDRTVMAEKANQLLEEFVANANARHDGAYLFGGTQTADSPFEVTRDADGAITAITYQGSDSVATVEIADGISVPAQLVGVDAQTGVFASDKADAFNALINLRDQLQAGANLTETDAQANVDAAFEQSLIGRTTVGAYMEQLSFASGLRTEQQGQIHDQLEKVEGVDISKAVSELSAKQMAYQAALSISAQTMRMSIMKYL